VPLIEDDFQNDAVPGQQRLGQGNRPRSRVVWSPSENVAIQPDGVQSVDVFHLEAYLLEPHVNGRFAKLPGQPELSREITQPLHRQIDPPNDFGTIFEAAFAIMAIPPTAKPNPVFGHGLSPFSLDRE